MFIREATGIGCPVRWLTGISCAGCGMTRAVLWAVRLQFDKAFYYHPLFWMLPLGGLVFFFRDKIPIKLEKCLAWLAVVCFGAVYLMRLFGPDQAVVAFEPKEGMLARLWEYFTEGR